MSLSQGEKAECKEIAREIIQEVLAGHIASCPHGIKIIKWEARFVGIVIGVSFVGGASALGLAQVITRFF